ncbi:MAG: thioredoxin family protein [Gammaproteobacteria bacterium]
MSDALVRYVIPLVAGALLLAGIGLYHWMGNPKSSNATAPMVSEAAPIGGNDQPTLVEIAMDRCASCKAMHNVLDELRAAHGEYLRVIDVNIMHQPEAVAQWKIRVVPTQILRDDQGQEFYRHGGFLSAQAIRARFAAQALPLDSPPQTP